MPQSYIRPMIDLHKSIGITVLLLFVARVVWRLTHRPPELPQHYKTWENAPRTARIAPSIC